MRVVGTSPSDDCWMRGGWVLTSVLCPPQEALKKEKETGQWASSNEDASECVT